MSKPKKDSDGNSLGHGFAYFLKVAKEAAEDPRCKPAAPKGPSVLRALEVWG